MHRWIIAWVVLASLDSVAAAVSDVMSIAKLLGELDAVVPGEAGPAHPHVTQLTRSSKAARRWPRVPPAASGPGFIDMHSL